ncbi:MAG: hypothetical protein Q8Q56_00675 [Alphaproteobacteria bacterium]|nr:hypothetical protein [Alphaproteobacteria bacterium]
MRQRCLRLCSIWLCVGVLTLSTNEGAAEGEPPKWDQPILEGFLVEYFATKSRVRMDVSVEDATGKGEKALDFFLIEPGGDAKNIPTTLRSILPRSRFLQIAIDTLLRPDYKGSGVLKITESLSEPGVREKVNGFIGITAHDVPEGGLRE